MRVPDICRLLDGWDAVIAWKGSSSSRMTGPGVSSIPHREHRSTRGRSCPGGPRYRAGPDSRCRAGARGQADGPFSELLDLLAHDLVWPGPIIGFADRPVRVVEHDLCGHRGARATELALTFQQRSIRDIETDGLDA